MILKERQNGNQNRLVFKIHINASKIIIIIIIITIIEIKVPYTTPNKLQGAEETTLTADPQEETREPDTRRKQPRRDADGNSRGRAPRTAKPDVQSYVLPWLGISLYVFLLKEIYDADPGGSRRVAVGQNL